MTMSNYIKNIFVCIQFFFKKLACSVLSILIIFLFTFTQQVSAEQPKLVWELNKEMVKSNLFSVTSNEDTFIAVGADGKIQLSHDGLLWHGVDSKFNNDLLDVCWNESIYVVVGSDGLIITSTDGYIWTKSYSGTEKTISVVEWDGNQFIAFAHNNVLTSPDGYNWNSDIISIINSDDIIHDLVSNGNDYIAVGEGVYGNVIMRSDNGIEWDYALIDNSLQSTGINSVIWDGSSYIAVGEKLYYSNNGHDWNILPPPNNAILRSIYWTGESYYAVGGDPTLAQLMRIYTSTNGYDWDMNEYPHVIYSLYSITGQGGTLVAVGNNNLLITSTDAINWSVIDGGNYREFNNIYYNGQKYILTDKSNIYSSDDGLYWIQRTFNSGNYGSGKTVWNGKQYITAYEYGKIFRSYDGEVWEFTGNLVNESAYGGTDIIWDGKQFVYLCGGNIYLSENADNWTKVNIPIENGLRKAVYNGNSYVVIGGITKQGNMITSDGYDGFVISSNDGHIWEHRLLNECGNLFDIAFNGNLFVAVGYGGTILYSENGVDWYNANQPINSTLRHIIWDGKRFVVTGSEANGLSGVILISEDGIDWVKNESSRYIQKITWDGSRYHAFTNEINGGIRILCSYDAINWTESLVKEKYFEYLREIIFTGTGYLAVGSKNSIYYSYGLQEQCDLKLLSNPIGSGEVFGKLPYNKGSIIEVFAAPYPGFDFTNWTIDGIEQSTNPNYSFLINEDMILTANFSAYDPIQEIVLDENPSDITLSPVKPIVSISFSPGTDPADATINIVTNTPEPKVILPQTNGQYLTPQMNITGNNGVQVNISAGTIITGPSGWNGTINLPVVISTPSQNFGDNQFVIKAGVDNGSLNFSEPVKLFALGQGKKEVKVIRNGIINDVTHVLSNNTLAAAKEALTNDRVDAKYIDGNDLYIWTTRFSEFIAYTPVSISPGGGGGGATTPKGQRISTDGGTVSDMGVSIYVPANAIAKEIYVLIEKLGELSHHIPEQCELVSEVYNITRDGKDDFKYPVTITLSFDKKKANEDEHTVNIYWYDEQNKVWEQLDNIIVDWVKGRVTGQVNHFTKFAVFSEKNKQVILPEEPEVIIKDIKGHWAEKDITKLVIKKAISGYPDGNFLPERPITRAEFAVTLVKAYGLPLSGGKIFKDSGNHWARDYIAAANAYNIISGYNDDSFGPDDQITREQMAVMINNVAKFDANGMSVIFTDKNDISEWAKNAVERVASNKVINGYPDGSFKPKQSTTRAEAVTVIVKSLEF